jgi:hypothetical protein
LETTPKSVKALGQVQTRQGAGHCGESASVSKVLNREGRTIVPVHLLVDNIGYRIPPAIHSVLTLF